MSKYIDAEKLKAEIERLKDEYTDIAIDSHYGTVNANSVVDDLERLLSFTDTLQQEQPEPSNNLVDVDAVREYFIAEVYRVLDADPTNDRANAIIDAFDSLPTVSQEQPEVELEKASRNVYESWMGGTMDNFLRDMVELGKALNARKEEL